VGSTTIYVTHDQDEALSLADRVVVMRAGSIRQVGTPTELYETPAHLDVAEFMGFRNRIAGTVVSREGGRATVDVNGAKIAGAIRDDVAVGRPAVLAIRPDDLVAGDAKSDSIAATVETIEYRGREFVGTAHAGDLALVFRSDRPVAADATVHLSAAPERVLVYAGGT
jgi:putative spermidine/putrescine transport system ATP-binding protein